MVEEIEEIIKTSKRIKYFINISNEKNEIDESILKMVIKNEFIIKDFNNIYKLINECYEEVRRDRIRKIFENINKDLIAIKEYIKENKEIEYEDSIIIFCNYINTKISEMIKNEI